MTMQGGHRPPYYTDQLNMVGRSDILIPVGGVGEDRFVPKSTVFSFAASGVTDPAYKTRCSHKEL